MNVEESIVIQVPCEKLFDYLTDVNNRSQYIPALEEVVMIDEGPIEEGSRYIEVSTIAGRRLETTYQVTSFERNRRITAQTLKSIFPIKVDLLFYDRDSYTTLNIELDFELKGIFRLASGVVRGIVRQQAKDILMNMKRSVENI